MSDTIYIDSKGRYISKHLIKTIFGKETIIELKIDEVERITDDNICSFDYRYYIYKLKNITEYEMPKELKDYGISRAPQSFQYVK